VHRHPVYPFQLILREVRKEAGLTVLAAAEATSYGNYERWESGKTKVGAHHLGAIADAFHIDDDLFRLVSTGASTRTERWLRRVASGGAPAVTLFG
jgi:transcriptional regulator with XRE-family HTH domain